MSFSISGKTAIVTGAAAGVGLAIARHFALSGANVVFADEDEDALQAALGDENDGGPDGDRRSDDRRSGERGGVAPPGGGKSGGGGQVRARVLEPSSKLSIANLVSSTIDAFDRIDILVNAASRLLPPDTQDSAGDTIEPMLEANLLPALRLTQAVVKRILAQADQDRRDAAGTDAAAGTVGVIVNVSSIAAVRPMMRLPGYSVAMAALDQLTRTMAVTLAPERVRVNGLAFASVQANPLAAQLKASKGLRAAVLAATPLGRIAGAAELAEVAQFLASPASDFMTGQILMVDGGRSLVDAVGLASG